MNKKSHTIGTRFVDECRLALDRGRRVEPRLLLLAKVLDHVQSPAIQFTQTIMSQALGLDLKAKKLR